jgi:haloalkane dehalogenase
MEAIVRPRRWEDFPKGRDAMFRAFRSAEGEHLILDDNAFIEVVMPKSILRSLSDTEMDAYREPFRERDSRLPMLVWPAVHECGLDRGAEIALGDHVHG